MRIVAHRGASFEYPENTLASAEAAWREGADAVEIDVRLSRDGRIVVMHDETAKRTAGDRRRISDMTFAELESLDAGLWKKPAFLGERVPSLETVVASIPAGRQLYVEVKCGPEIVPALIALNNASVIDASQLVLISFDLAVCRAVKQALPAYSVYLIVGKQKYAPELPVLFAECKGLDGLDLNSDWRIDSAFVAAVRGAGFGLCVWTVDSAKAAARCSAAGVDGITTNRPGWLRAELTKLGIV